MATIFWDSQGILLIDFKEKNKTVNAQHYAVLLHCFRAAIKQKIRFCRCVRLLHENLPVHTALISSTIVKEIFHPPYNPDQVPSNYYPFVNLKSDFRWGSFSQKKNMRHILQLKKRFLKLKLLEARWAIFGRKKTMDSRYRHTEVHIVRVEEFSIVKILWVRFTDIC